MALEIVRKEIVAAASVSHNHLKRQLLSSTLSGTPTTTSLSGFSTPTNGGNGGTNGDPQPPNDQLHDKMDDLESFIADLAKLIADEFPACNSNDNDSMSSTSLSGPTASSSTVIPPPENTFTDSTIIRSPPVTSGALSVVQWSLSSASEATLSSIPTAPIALTVSYQNSTSSSSPAAATATGDSSSPPSLNNTNTTTTPSTPSNRSSSQAFNPLSPSNLAVYYGQTPLTSTIRLSTLCTNPSIDIIILAFITSFSSPSPPTTTTSYPTINFSSYCTSGPSAAQSAARATGLLDCTQDLAPEIQMCQNQGKKVFLSLGGAAGASGMIIGSEEEARERADVVWGLFGEPDGGEMDALRPFGDVVVDGFDDDNESATSTHWPAFLTRLRSHFAPSSSSSSPTKPFFLSSAPQCPLPDASIPGPPALTTLFDFVWVQFYNNPSCQLGNSAGFLESVGAWSQLLSGSASSDAGGKGGFVDVGNGVKGGPRLYVGAVSWEGGSGGGGYVDAETLTGLVGQAKGVSEGKGNFGGVMLWDGAEGVGNGGFLEEVKGGLVAE
ncbi:MAG: hypothetical protein Q9160_005034 [Pyrenula sp. 1 TL-2023]